MPALTERDSVDERPIYEALVEFGTRPYIESVINISLVHRYVYVHNAKVASSTIKKTLLSEELKRSKIRDKKVSVHDRRSSPLLWPGQLPSKMFQDVMRSGDYFIFTFVRNPYSRVLSGFLDKFGEGNHDNPGRKALMEELGRPVTDQLTFAEFLDAIAPQDPRHLNHHWRHQTDCVFYGAIDYDFIGRFEAFGEQFDTVKKHIFAKGRRQERQIQTQDLVPHQTNSDAKLADHYTPELAERVYEIYEKDFVNFGYPKELPKAPASC